MLGVEGSSWAHAKRALVVDDNRLAADTLVTILNILGGHAKAVYGSKEVLACEVLAEFDIVLLDIGMPQMDGYEVVRILRARGAMPPFVALTGYGLPEDKQKALDAGFAAHLTKPVSIKDVKGVFKKLFPVAV